MATTTIEFRRPWLYEKQLNAVYEPKRFSLVEASTKSGKTFSCIVWIIEQALFGGGNGRNYWWVAPVVTQADIAFTRALRYLPTGWFTANRTLKTIVLFNGAVIWFKGADRPDTLYGDDVHGAVIDEASRVKEEAYLAVRTTLTATRGTIRIIGNVKGRRNWFYRLSRRAEDGDPDMAFHKMTAFDAVTAGVLSQDEIEGAKRQMPEHAFRELYLAEASDDEGNPFGLAAIRLCIRDMSPREPVAWGWDLGKSVDYTVGIGLDDSGVVCRFRRFQKPWKDTIEIIRRDTGMTPALVDSTGLGDPIVEANLQTNYGGNFEGFKFTSQSKQQLMEGLAVGIHKGEVGYPDGPIVIELEQFEYAYGPRGVRYSAPAGQHDDAVCSLALAHRCRDKRRGTAIWSKLGED